MSVTIYTADPATRRAFVVEDGVRLMLTLDGTPLPIPPGVEVAMPDGTVHVRSLAAPDERPAAPVADAAPAELHHPSNPNPARMARELQGVLQARGIKVEDWEFRYHTTLAIEFVLSGYVRGLEHMFGQLAREIAWDSRHERPAVTVPTTGVEPMVRACAFHAYASRNSLESAIASAAWPSDMPTSPERSSATAQDASASRTVPEVPVR